MFSNSYVLVGSCFILFLFCFHFLMFIFVSFFLFSLFLFCLFLVLALFLSNKKITNITLGIGGHEFYFAENGDGPARYRIIHYKQIRENVFDWIQVGEYVDGNLEIDLSLVPFRLNRHGFNNNIQYNSHGIPSSNGHGVATSSNNLTNSNNLNVFGLDDTSHGGSPTQELPISVCSQPCEKGQAKSYLEGEKCCFHCINCTKYQVLLSETQCVDCPSGYLPNAEQTECVEIPGKELFHFYIYFYLFSIFFFYCHAHRGIYET